MSKAVVIPATQLYDIPSEHADAGFQVWVAEPVEGVVPFPPGPRRVVYVLDANLFFGTVVETTRLMSQLYGELPPLLVVGIGYDTTSPAVEAELRAWDFTPTTDSGFGDMAQSMPGALEPTLPEGRRLGRAPELLRFLLEEAVPFVEERYDVAEAGATLFGSSLGALFTLYAMLERPDAFDGYIAVSPALWWDDAFLLRREEELAGAREDLDARLYLAVGANEERPEIPALAPFKMVSNVETFAVRLERRGYPSLELTTDVVDDASHTTVVPIALTRALQHLFRRPSPTA